MASPPVPTGGALGVQLVPTANVEQSLQAGAFETGMTIPMELRFTWATGANDAPLATAYVVCEGIDSTVTPKNLATSQDLNFGAEFTNPTLYKIPYSNYSAGSRVVIPVDWTVSGRYASSAQVMVVLVTRTSGKLMGRAAFTVGVQGTTKIVKPARSLDIFMNQLNALKADPVGTASQLKSGSNDTIPFIPANHRQELDLLESRGSDYDRKVRQ